MIEFRNWLVCVAVMLLVSACGKTEGQGQSAGEQEPAATVDSQMELTEEQVLAMEADAVRIAESSAKKEQENGSAVPGADGAKPSTGGLTEQQYAQTKAALVASGMTEEQADAMLALGAAKTPGGPEQLERIAAMDPRAHEDAKRSASQVEAMKSSGVMVRYDGVDYPMQYTKPQACGDFFGFLSHDFVARTSPDEKSGPTMSFNGNATNKSYSFAFWLDFDPVKRFRRDYATAIITLVEKDGGFVAFEGTEDGAELNLANNRGLVVEDSRLSYEGPVAPNSDKIISIEAKYCPRG